jgi:ATPase subunit of ABC transporter with duplicated ATPase domains
MLVLGADWCGMRNISRPERSGEITVRAARPRSTEPSCARAAVPARWDTVLQARGLSVEVGGRLVVAGASFTVRARDKVGLVGRNGAGKTSLLRVLGGAADPTAGAVHRGGALGYLPQDPRLAGVLDGRTAIAHVLSGRSIDESLVRIEKLRLAMAEHASDRNVARYSRAEEEFRAAGGYAAESEARAIGHGLGLGADRLDLPLGVLSGGERRRVELARILFAGSDILLLDEPTNHLDVDARNWLLAFLRAYRGALLVISHDLELLDEAITRVLHLDRTGEEETGQLIAYRGTYSQYRAARARDEERAAKLAAAQAKEVDRLQTLVDRFGAKATKASFAHNLERRIERIERDRAEVGRGEGRHRVRFPAPPRPGATVLEVTGLTKGYGGPPVFEYVGFDVGRGERMLILGLNGAGKTSLLRIVAGVTDADDGTVAFGHNVSAGYYAQEHDQLVAERTALDHLRAEAIPGSTDTQLRSILGSFRLSGDKVFQEAGTFSGGEKTKLALAQLMVGRHNLLLLDEPTNNLDPPSREAVAEALASWPGAIVLVSHDTEFVQRLEPTKVLLMPDGQLDVFDDDWLDLVALA